MNEMPGTHEDALEEIRKLRAENALQRGLGLDLRRANHSLRSRLARIAREASDGPNGPWIPGEHTIDKDVEKEARLAVPRPGPRLRNGALLDQVTAPSCDQDGPHGHIDKPWWTEIPPAAAAPTAPAAEQPQTNLPKCEGVCCSHTGGHPFGAGPDEPDVCYRQVGFFSCLLPAGHDPTTACPGATPRETIAKDHPQVTDPVAAYGHGGFDKQNEGQ